MRGLRLALRTLFRTPFVTSVAILSLALGIGANTAIFSLFEEVLLAPLPVQEPDRLVNLSAPGPKPGSQQCGQAGDCEQVFSYPMFRDLESASTLFSGIAAHWLFGTNVAFGEQTLNGEGMLVSGSYFEVLRLRPALGRLLGPADDEAIGAHPVAVLGHDFWETQLGARPDVLGESIVVNGRPLTIVGVAPAGFRGTTLGARPLVYVPLTMRAAITPTFAGFDNRRQYWIYAFARLQPGVTIDQAEASVNAVYTPIIREVEAPLQTGMSEQALARFLDRRVGLEDGRRGQSSIHEFASAPLLLLFATAGLVLLIACANIANLLLVRGASRGMEMAVRLSLGARRGQVLQQLLTESVVLAVLGGVASLFVAQWTLAGVAMLLPPEAVNALALELSMPAVIFAALLSVVTGLLFGIFPALHSTRADLVSTIRANTGNLSATRGAARFRNTLATAQIALSMALLITAGLFLRSLTNISRVELGLRTDHVVTFAVSPSLSGYEPQQARQLFERLEDELAAIPGVLSVSTSLVPLLSGSNWSNDVSVEGFERGPDTNANSNMNEVGTGYFATLGIPLRAGRDFTAADDAGRPAVAVVNEAFTRKFDLGRDAVGKRMGLGGINADLDVAIIGVVADAKYSEVKDDIPPVFFRPWRQNENTGSLVFYLHAGVDPATVMPAIRSAVARLDPNLPVQNLKTLPQQVRENIFLDRMIGTLSASFAALATLLAAIGLYGVLAYSVERRTREIGVRMAVGANSRAVRMLVMRQVALMLVLGGTIGVLAALALARLAGALLYGVGTSDPLTIVAAVVLLAAIALAAAYLPAHRATRVEPMRVLRFE